jgi:hypothetical protein
MKKQNQILAGTLVVMLAAIVWLITSADSGGSAVAQDVFSIEKQEEIDAVQIQSLSDTINLRFAGARWQLNLEFAADRRMIKLFFATLDQVRPVREVKGAEADSARQWLARQGATVSLYKNQQRVFQFTAGGNPTKSLSYFQHADGRIYAMHIPGYRVYASGIFETSPLTWREKRLFDFNWQNFKSLALTSRDSGQDFEITFNGSAFGIAGLATDTARLNSYLDDVSLMAADEFYKVGTSAALDSALQTTAAFVIRVQDVGSRTYKLEVFSPRPRVASVAARLNGEPLVLSREKAAILAKKKSYFQGGNSR